MAIYFNGKIVSPTLVIPHNIYDKVTQCATGNITLTETSTVYNLTPTSDTIINFDTTNLANIDTEFVTFMLVLDFTNGLQSITWPTNVEWGNITPTMTANAKYMFSFTKPVGSDKWIGNQMYSWS